LIGSPTSTPFGVVATFTACKRTRYTVTVAVAVLQLGVGVARSHNWYVFVYVPGATLEATETAPVDVLSVIPVVHVPDTVMVEFDELAAAPFTVSLARTSAMAVEPVPETAVPLSFAGVIAPSSLVIVPVAEAVPIVPPILLVTLEMVAITVSLASSVVSEVGSASNVVVSAPAAIVNVLEAAVKALPGVV
jgi:hypothetical protein